MDLTLLVPTGVLSQGGLSYSVGMLACISNLKRLYFSSFCRYYGASNSMANVNVGVSGGGCAACCTEDILGNSTGGQISYQKISFSWDISDSKCYWASYAPPLIPDEKIKDYLSGSQFMNIFMYLYKNPNSGAYLPTGSGVIRNCYTDEIDFRYMFSYWTSKLLWLKNKLP